MQDCLVENTPFTLPPYIVARPKPTPKNNPRYLINLDDAAMLLESVTKQLALDKTCICINKKYFEELRKDIARKMQNNSAEEAQVLKNIDMLLRGIQSLIWGNK